MPTPVLPPTSCATHTIPGSSAPCSSSCCASPSAGTSSTEGLEKIESTRNGKQAVLGRGLPAERDRAARPVFPRHACPTSTAWRLLDPARLKASWAETSSGSRPLRVRRGPAGQGRKDLLEQSDVWADIWFSDIENDEKRRQVPPRTRARSSRSSANPEALSFERERAWRAAKDLDGDRKKLTGRLDAQGQALRRGGRSTLATPEQQAAAGPYVAPLDLARHGQLPDDVRPVRDGRLPDPRASSPRWPRSAPRPSWRMIYLSHAPLAGPAAQPQGRGALLDRQQEPGRDDRLPARRHHGQRPLVRPRRPVLRPAAAAAAGIATSGSSRRSTASSANGKSDDSDHREPVHVATRSRSILFIHEERANDEPDPRSSASWAARTRTGPSA